MVRWWGFKENHHLPRSFNFHSLDPHSAFLRAAKCFSEIRLFEVAHGETLLIGVWACTGTRLPEAASVSCSGRQFALQR